MLADSAGDEMVEGGGAEVNFMNQHPEESRATSIKSLNGGPVKFSSLVLCGIAGITWLPAAPRHLIGCSCIALDYMGPRAP